MTLNCLADNCVYNIYGICYAGNINIVGENASTTTATTCSTFVEKKGDSLSNCTSNTFTTSTDIYCNAKKCNYNADNCCTASSVQISHNSACCETFKSF